VNLPTVACPSGGYTPVAWPGYDPSDGVLKISSGTLTLSAPGTYYFHDVTVSAGATLAITSGGHVDIFVERKWTATGGGIVNPSALPANLTIWGCGTDDTSWALSAGTTYLAMYAPTHRVTLSASGQLFGSLVAGEVVDNGGAQVHYDKALARQPGGSGKFTNVSGSWTELAL